MSKPGLRQAFEGLPYDPTGDTEALSRDRMIQGIGELERREPTDIRYWIAKSQVESSLALVAIGFFLARDVEKGKATYGLFRKVHDELKNRETAAGIR